MSREKIDQGEKKQVFRKGKRKYRRGHMSREKYIKGKKSSFLEKGKVFTGSLKSHYS
jgi:hypothetical protein